jgi:hypothetical protein
MSHDLDWLTCDGCLWVSQDHTYCTFFPGGSEICYNRQCAHWKCAGCLEASEDDPGKDHTNCLEITFYGDHLEAL